MHIYRCLIWLCLALLCSACGSRAGGQVESPAVAPTAVVPQVTPAATPQVSRPTTTLPPGAAQRASKLAEQARADLAQRLGLPLDDVRLVSLGRDQVPIDLIRCNRPAESKATPVAPPAQVVALVIQLEANGQQYTYYSRGRQMRFCEQ